MPVDSYKCEDTVTSIYSTSSS